MLLKVFLPSSSVIMLLFAVVHVARSKETWESAAPLQAPPRSPFDHTVAGAGVIEAQTENIELGSPVPGLVQEVFVQEGDAVVKDQPLFRLDDRELTARLAVTQAALVAATAELSRLEQMPRSEQVPVYQARVREAQANLADQEYQYNWRSKLLAEGKATETELVLAEQGYLMAQARLAGAQAELELLQAGAWESDLSVARAAVTQAEAQVDQVKTELDRLVIRAPVDSQVLQMNVRSGEFVASPPLNPLVVLGNLQRLHVRVDIDEYDISRFSREAPARALVRGSMRDYYPLSFVRLEPFVIPKRSLTGGSFERVDTRVLQVIYVIDPQGRQLFVGQQVDVFIEVPPDGVAQQQPAVSEGPAPAPASAAAPAPAP